jgi:hypothetical protein
MMAAFIGAERPGTMTRTTLLVLAAALAGCAGNRDFGRDAGETSDKKFLTVEERAYTERAWARREWRDKRYTTRKYSANPYTTRRWKDREYEDREWSEPEYRDRDPLDPQTLPDED